MYVLQFCHIIPTHTRAPAVPALFTQTRLRKKVRERYGIRGNKCGDCLTVVCCAPCTHTQERREIELEEGSF